MSSKLPLIIFCVILSATNFKFFSIAVYVEQSSKNLTFELQGWEQYFVSILNFAVLYVLFCFPRYLNNYHMKGKMDIYEDVILKCWWNFVKEKDNNPSLSLYLFYERFLFK